MKSTFLASSIDSVDTVLTHPFGAVLLVLALISLAPVVASTAGIELARQKHVAICDPSAR